MTRLVLATFQISSHEKADQGYKTDLISSYCCFSGLMHKNTVRHDICHSSARAAKLYRINMLRRTFLEEKGIKIISQDE